MLHPARGVSASLEFGNSVGRGVCGERKGTKKACLIRFFLFCPEVRHRDAQPQQGGLESRKFARDDRKGTQRGGRRWRPWCSYISEMKFITARELIKIFPYFVRRELGLRI